MVFITGFGLVFAFMVATSEAVALGRITLGSGLKTGQYPSSFSPAAWQKVIYYSTPYNLDFYAAKAYCESRGTYIATLEDLEAAYQDGYEGYGCGWTANGISYHVMQDSNDIYRSSIGVTQCSWESRHGVFCKRPISVFMSKDPRGNYNMTLVEARQHCHQKGTRLATYEDLLHAYSMGYEDSSCGWVDNGISYFLMQKSTTQGDMTSVGVIECNKPMIWNAFCKNSEWEQYPSSWSSESSLHMPGKSFATTSHKVTYYSTPYTLDFYAAKAYCESRRTYIATMEDLELAYQNGYQGYGCGWAANGNSYLVMQEASDSFHSSAGVTQCSWVSTHGVFCKRPITVFISKDPRSDYSMTLDDARHHCHGKGTRLATYEDLLLAHSLGFEDNSCGWADNGLTYALMQKSNQGDMTNVGVMKCNGPTTLNAFCKGSDWETYPYPSMWSSSSFFPISGRRFATASHKVIYYSTPYNIDFYAAKAYCESRGTYIATLEELEIAYQNGFEGYGCGWAANGMPYRVMQDTRYGYHASIGIKQCSLGSSHGVFCKRPMTVFMSKDPRSDYSMTLADARQHCHGKGTRLATYEELLQAYGMGYECNSCGWTDSGLAYSIMQNPSQGEITSVGVVKCNSPTTLNAFCKGYELETEFPGSFSAMSYVPLSGQGFASPLYKDDVIINVPEHV